MTNEEKQLLKEATGGFNEYSLNEKNTKIFQDIINRLSSSNNDKEDYFHNSRIIHFIQSPLSPFHEIFRITDIMIIADEVLHYLQMEKEL